MGPTSSEPIITGLKSWMQVACVMAMQILLHSILPWNRCRHIRTVTLSSA